MDCLTVYFFLIGYTSLCSSYFCYRVEEILNTLNLLSLAFSSLPSMRLAICWARSASLRALCCYWIFLMLR